jgi:protein-tyrosine phosphatase
MLQSLRENCKIFLQGNQQIVDVDMHAHILPFHDNGPTTFEESIEMCEMLVQLGFRKCIATPHVMHEFYDNSEEKIKETTQILVKKLHKANINLEIRPAAEYFVDHKFLAKLRSNKPLLTLDNDYHVLIETTFMNEFDFLKHAIERLQTYGYQPVLAHPEKFNYLFEEDKKILILKEMGIKLQANMSSFLSSNIKSTKENLQYLIDHKLIDFIGSNISSLESAIDLIALKENPNFQKTLKDGLQNQNLRF